jgi:two-component system sensor histidine kinase KdpD
VISTLNIQHLEGLNDLVESITGVRQRETVPDRLLDEADEVELVDIAPDALRARLRHGNVYPPERAQKALDNYFSQGNLTALRELALRRMAEKTETQLDELMRRGDETKMASSATERVMVAFDERPLARQLLRDGWRLARGLKAPLLAVTITRPDWVTLPSDNAERRALEEHIRLAEDLGAETLRIDGRDVAGVLARLAQERHVTQLVIGAPVHTPWRELLFGSMVTRLLRAPLAADIHIVRARQPEIRG